LRRAARESPSELQEGEGKGGGGGAKRSRCYKKLLEKGNGCETDCHINLWENEVLAECETSHGYLQGRKGEGKGRGILNSEALEILSGNTSKDGVVSCYEKKDGKRVLERFAWGFKEPFGEK